MPNSSLGRQCLAVLSSLLFLFGISGIGGCGGGSEKVAPVTLASIIVSPSNSSIALGLTQQLTASGTYSDGTTKSLTSSVTWSTGAASIATVSSAGLATSLAPGSATITAALGTVTGSTTITVTAPTLKSISISPSSISLAKGTTQQFTATGTFTDASQQTLTNVTWTSSSPGTATVQSSGLATAVAVGTATVTATSGSLTATAALTVVPPALAAITVNPANATVAAGLTQQFTATGIYTDQSTQPLTSVAWSVSDPGSATAASNGLVTTLHSGSETVIASSGSVQGSASLTITAPLLTGITVSPSSATLQFGSNTSKDFTATGSYTDKSTADITSQVDWEVSNAQVASVSAGGSALPIRAGFSKVSASLDNLSGTASLTVLSAPRYLYEVTDAGRDVSRLVVNAATGQLRHWGYQSTSEVNGVGASCISTDPSNQFVYVTNAISASSGSGYDTSVSAYSVDAASGTLTSLGAPYTLQAAVGCLQFEPKGNYAYGTPAILQTTQQIAVLAKSSTGALSVKSTVSLPDYAAGLAIDPLGQFLYVSTEQLVTNAKAFVYGYKIDSSSGSLIATNQASLALPNNTGASLSFSPSGDFLYLADSNGTTVTGYTVDRKTGSIAGGVASISPCINPSALRFSPDGALAFVTCGESADGNITSNNLVSLSVGPNGSLAQAGTASAYLSPSGLTVDPSGKFLYVISSGSHYIQTGPGSYNGGFNSVVTYTIQPDGSVSELDETAGRFGERSMLLLGGAAPVTITNKWVFVTDTAPGNIIDPVSYQLKSFYPDGGGADLLLRESINALDNPFSLSTLPWHSDLLLASTAAAPSLESYQFDDSTTLLSTGQPFGAGSAPGGVIIDPSGMVAFSSEPSTGNVYWYGHDSSSTNWFTLLNSSGVPAFFAAEQGAGPLAISPSGRYLFVANQSAKSISEFEFAGAAPKAAYPLTTTPIAIATDPTGNLLFFAGADNKLHMLVIDVNGDLTDVADQALAGIPTSVVVEPSGNYVYVTSSDGLAGFSINQAKGTLQPLQISLPMSLAGAKSVNAEPSGKLLYVIAPSTTFCTCDGIYALSIGADGSVTALSTTTLAVLSNTSSVAFRASAQ